MTPTLTPDLTRSPECAAFVRACVADYDEDTPRLALADWLEENGDPDRAEFVRVQCELARHVDKEGYRLQDPKCTRPQKDHYVNREMNGTQCIECWRKEYARQSALLAEHEARWRRGAKCEACEDWGGKWGWTKEKGAKHLQRDCPVCHGTGWRNWWMAGLKQQELSIGNIAPGWRHPVRFERGFITQVDANLRDLFDERGNATEWAKAGVAGEPFGRRFGVVDKKPADRNRINERWYWFKRDQRVYPEYSLPPEELAAFLPAFLFEALPGTDHNTIGMPNDSPAAANRALAEAAWREVGEQVGEAGSRWVR